MSYLRRASTTEPDDDPRKTHGATAVSAPARNHANMNVYISPQPTKIELVGSLDDGSLNNDSGKGTQKGMLADGSTHGINKVYTFHVKTYAPAPKSSSYHGTKWRVIYTSAATSKHRGKKVAWMCSTMGPVLQINLAEEFGEAGYDMCGGNITVVAWVGENTEADAMLGAKITVFVHYRFRWFDAQKILDQVEQRMKEPWRIDQGQTPLCGIAAVYYAMLKRDAREYKRLAIELHRTGIYRPERHGVETGYKIVTPFHMHNINPATDKKYQATKIWDIDWIVLAGTRGGESILGYNGTSGGDDSSGATMSWLVSKLLKNVAGYGSVDDEANTIFRKSDAVDILKEIDRKYTAGNGKSQFLFEIDFRMLTGGEESFLTGLTARHWVVYAGGLVTATNYVKFKVYTWGRNPETGERYYPVNSEQLRYMEIRIDKGISQHSFGDSFYGYVEGDC
jgi:hypothetical protein